MLIVSDMVTLYFTDFQQKAVFKETKKTCTCQSWVFTQKWIWMDINTCGENIPINLEST